MKSNKIQKSKISVLPKQEILKVLIFIILILIIISGVMAFQSDSSTYSSRSKFDFGGAVTNASSTNFIQRFIFGSQPVSQYTDSIYSGRFGILDERSSVAINLTSPLINAEIVRGGNIISNEDTESLVSDFIKIFAKVYVNDTIAGVPNATVYFYFNDTLIGNNATNSTGDAVMSYDKTTYSAGIYNLSVNYSHDDYELVINNFLSNFSLIVFNIPNTQGNRGVATQYVWNQTAIFYFNITKTNSSGTFFYDPQNITANATDSTDKHYPAAAYVSGYKLKKNAQGQYETRVFLNQTLMSTYTAVIKWKIYISDDNYSTYLASARHSDIDVVAGPICGNSLIEIGEGCDDGNLVSGDGCSTLCATEGGGGGGGGGGGVDECINGCSPSGAEQKTCVTLATLKTTTCGNYDADSCLEWGGENYTDCGTGFSCENAQCVLTNCNNYWQCGNWGECFFGNSKDYLKISNPFLDESSLKSEMTELVLNKTIVEEDLIQNSLIDDVGNFLGMTGGVVDNSCSSSENVGDKKCDSVKNYKYQECKSKIRKGKASFYWGIGSCPRGLICEGEGKCSCSDVNSCETLGEKICSSSNKYKTCEKDKNSCLKLSSEKWVPRGMVCENGEAVCSLTNSCEILGEKICSSSNKYKICETDKNNCLKLGSDKRCARGQVCDADSGLCLLKHCVDGFKNFDEEEIDCGGSCLKCVVEIPTNQTNQTIPTNQTASINETNITQKDIVVNIIEEKATGEKTYLVSINESVIISSNIGNSLYVTYEKRDKNLILLRIISIKTGFSTDETITHSVKVDSIIENNITVTVSSDPITKDIQLGGTAIFEFPLQAKLSPGTEWIQTRNCKNSVCSLPDKTEIRNCKPCSENWDCQWAICGVGDTLSYPYGCVDLNNCGTATNKPIAPKVCEKCQEIWICEWSECAEGDKYSYPRNCYDMNKCGTEINKPINSTTCEEREKIIEEQEENLRCPKKWKCGELGKCNAKYNLNDVLKDKIFAEGYSSRECVNLNGCSNNKTEKKPCDLNIPIYAKETEWCNEDYVEIFEIKTDKLVSRVKEKEIAMFSDLNRVDISFITSEFTGYCDYCFDGVKDYDETGLDCGGPNCPKCVPKFSFFDWLFWVILILWILFVLFIIILFWKRRKEEEKKKEIQKKKSLFEKIKLWFAKIKPIKRKEIVKERKIQKFLISVLTKQEVLKFENFFKRLFGKKKEIERIRKPEVEVRRVVSPEERMLAQLKSKLKKWKEEGYAGTSAIEAKIVGLENRIKQKQKSFIKRIVSGYRKRREEKRLGKIRTSRQEEIERMRIEREKYLDKIRSQREWKKEKELLSVREKKIGNFFKNLFKSKKEKIEEHPIKHKIWFAGFISNLKKKREARKEVQKSKLLTLKLQEHKKLQERKIQKEFKKRIEKKEKEVQKKIRVEKKFMRKVRKKKIRGLKREIRKRKLIDLMRKLRLWKKEGYYGTAHLEEEIRKLRIQED